MTVKRVREGKVPSVYTSDCEGVLFMQELVGALLPLSGKATIVEMVAFNELRRRSDRRRRGGGAR